MEFKGKPRLLESLCLLCCLGFVAVAFAADVFWRIKGLRDALIDVVES